MFILTQRVGFVFFICSVNLSHRCVAKLRPYTLAGFDLTTNSSKISSVAGGDDTTKPRRQGFHVIKVNWG
jgi:hypothetical protein